MPIIQTKHRGVRSRHDTSVFTKETLENGATIWIQKSPVLLSDEGVIVAYFKNVGNVLDPEGKEGLAHFLEHMPFKGTKSFSNNQEMTEFARSRGGSINAATSTYYTKYFVTMPREYIHDAAKLLGELISTPAMREEDFSVERGVIESERQRKFENGAALAGRDVDMRIYGNHPAMSWGIGTQESIAAITLEDVRAFWNTYYHTGNLHLVVGGTFSEQQDIREICTRITENVPTGEEVQLTLPPIETPTWQSDVLKNTRYGRNRFTLEWVIPGTPEVADLDALDLLTSAFAGSIDSPLAVELRDKRGLVYESGLMGSGRIGDQAIVVSLNLPIPEKEYAEVSEAALRLLSELSDERIKTVLDRWQISRLSNFYYPTKVCLNLGGELAHRGEPRSIHADEVETDDIDLDRIHTWKTYLTTHPPVVVQTSPNE